MRTQSFESNFEQPADMVLAAGASGRVVVPKSETVLSGEYQRLGLDLRIEGADGESILIRNYFSGWSRPEIVSEGGARLDGALVERLAGPQAAAQYAQAAPVTAEPIGRVETITGDVSATRADGSTVQLSKGAPVFQGDELKTGADASVGVVFADDTTFSLADKGRMVLDELVYDPGSEGGRAAFSVMEGVFTFVSGKIAKTGVDSMTISTPAATIGIRGTAGAGEVKSDGSTTAGIMRESGGQLGEMTFRNGAGVQVLNQEFQATSADSFDSAPAQTFTMSAREFGRSFGSAINSLPNADRHLPNEFRETVREAHAEARQEREAQETQDEGDAEGETEGDQEGGEQTEGEGEGEGEQAAGEGEGEGELEGEGALEGEGELATEGELEGEGALEGEGELAAEGELEGEGPIEGEGEQQGALEGEGGLEGEGPLAENAQLAEAGPEGPGPEGEQGGEGPEEEAARLALESAIASGASADDAFAGAMAAAVAEAEANGASADEIANATATAQEAYDAAIAQGLSPEQAFAQAMNAVETQGPGGPDAGGFDPNQQTAGGLGQGGPFTGQPGGADPLGGQNPLGGGQPGGPGQPPTTFLPPPDPIFGPPVGSYELDYGYGPVDGGEEFGVYTPDDPFHDYGPGGFDDYYAGGEYYDPGYGDYAYVDYNQDQHQNEEEQDNSNQNQNVETNFSEVLQGTSGADNLQGGEGNTNFYFDKNDFPSSNDTINGGGGTNQVSFDELDNVRLRVSADSSNSSSGSITHYVGTNNISTSNGYIQFYNIHQYLFADDVASALQNSYQSATQASGDTTNAPNDGDNSGDIIVFPSLTGGEKGSVIVGQTSATGDSITLNDTDDYEEHALVFGKGGDDVFYINRGGDHLIIGGATSTDNIDNDGDGVPELTDTVNIFDYSSFASGQGLDVVMFASREYDSTAGKYRTGGDVFVTNKSGGVAIQDMLWDVGELKLTDQADSVTLRKESPSDTNVMGFSILDLKNGDNTLQVVHDKIILGNLSGGTGTDTLDLSALDAAVTVRYDTGTITSATNEFQATTVANFENAIGTSADDTLTAGAGSSTLTGGPGTDTLTGGADGDAFRYTAYNEIGDSVQDFASGTDKFLFVESSFEALSGKGTGAVSGLANVEFTTATGTSAPTGNQGSNTNPTFVFFNHDSNDANNGLYYDADGTGNSYSSTKIADTPNATSMAAADLELI